MSYVPVTGIGTRLDIGPSIKSGTQVARKSEAPGEPGADLR